MYGQFQVLPVCRMRLQAICPVFRDALKPEPLPVEQPPGVPGQEPQKA